MQMQLSNVGLEYAPKHANLRSPAGTPLSPTNYRTFQGLVSKAIASGSYSEMGSTHLQPVGSWGPSLVAGGQDAGQKCQGGLSGRNAGRVQQGIRLHNGGPTMLTRGPVSFADIGNLRQLLCKLPADG